VLEERYTKLQGPWLLGAQGGEESVNSFARPGLSFYGKSIHDSGSSQHCRSQKA